jgi:CheY-like chemotaxis protein
MSIFHDHFSIVMVEDDEGHARLIEKNLRRAGIGNDLTHIENGAKAIDYFFGKEGGNTKQQQTLVLLDLNLPEIDGYEIIRRLKNDDRTKAIPIIVLTTTDNPREIDRCYELGCNVYITKPVEYENFSDAIRKLGLMLAIVKIPQGFKYWKTNAV